MSENAVIWKKDGPVALITINRPDKRNCINQDVIEGMHTAFDELGADPEVKVIMTTGAGDASWMAGFDMNYLKGMYEGKYRTERCPELYYKVRHSPKATIAVVNGYCLGGAISMVCIHDMAIASDQAKFGLPEIFRGGVARYALAAIFSAVPKTYAMEMTLTGSNWDGYKAERTGLVNLCVPHAQLMEKAYEMGNLIGKWDAKAIDYNKRSAYRLLDVLNYEQRVDVNLMSHYDHHVHSEGGMRQGVEDMLAGKGLKATF